MTAETSWTDRTMPEPSVARPHTLRRHHAEGDKSSRYTISSSWVDKEFVTVAETFTSWGASQNASSEHAHFSGRRLRADAAVALTHAALRHADLTSTVLPLFLFELLHRGLTSSFPAAHSEIGHAKKRASISFDTLYVDLLKLLQQEPVLDGFSHPGETVLQRMFSDTPQEASNFIKDLFSSGKQSDNAADILKLLSRFKPETAKWRATVISSALRSSHEDVRDVAIQAIEFWEEPELAVLLKSHLQNETTDWLVTYGKQVLSDLES